MVSNIITRYTDHMKFAACTDFSFITFILFWFHFYHCIYGCVFCVVLFNFVNYEFLLLYLYIFIFIFIYSYCNVCSVPCILFHCVVLCIVCVLMCTVLLPPDVNPFAVNKIYQ